MAELADALVLGTSSSEWEFDPLLAHQIMDMYFICCYDRNNVLKHYEVPYEVYTYIHQLENCIKNPHVSKLKERYDFRFKSKNVTFYEYEWNWKVSRGNETSEWWLYGARYEQVCSIIY